MHRCQHHPKILEKNELQVELWDKRDKGYSIETGNPDDFSLAEKSALLSSFQDQQVLVLSQNGSEGNGHVRTVVGVYENAPSIKSSQD